MSENEAEKGMGFNRRDFIRGASFGTLMMMMGGVPLQAETTTNAAGGGNTNYSHESAPVTCAVIGCGLWGREILKTLAVLKNAPVAAICDTYAPWLKRAKNEDAPKAETYQDYRQVLEQKAVEAVIVATPSHKHKEIVLAALKAGKHVYCEAPLGTSVEDARAIAEAAKAAVKVNFQAGLQARSDPQRAFVRQFIRSGALGKNVMARAQWHKKTSWRRASPSTERDQELNWRLQKDTSAGLFGEIGIHQLDVLNWFFNELPTAATGFGGILNWNDGRNVADTIQSVVEYPGKANFMYDATLANSYDADYEVIYGTYAAVMMRGNKAWMFKEADSPTLGWEVYARRDKFFEETGISLALDASKQASLQAKVTTEVSYEDSPLHFALTAFVTNSHVTASGVENFKATYGDDAEGLGEYLATLSKGRLPAATYQEGFEATVSAIKANEAVVKGQKIMLEKEWFKV